MGGPAGSKPSAGSKSGTLDVGVTLVGVAIKVVWDEATKTPARALRALEKPEVQKKITEAVRNEAAKLARERAGGGKGSGQLSAAAAGAIGKTAGKAVLNDVKKQVENSPGVKQIKAEGKRLTEAFKKSPVGVFLDTHDWVIYVVAAVGVAAAGGAAVAIYNAKNDTLGKALEQIDVTIPIGTFTIGAKVTSFKPSTHDAGGRLTLKRTLTNVKYELGLSGMVKGPTAMVAADGKVVLRVDPHMSLFAAGRLQYGFDSGIAATADKPLSRGWAGDAGVGFQYTENDLKISVLYYLRQTSFLNAQPGAAFADTRLKSLLGMSTDTGGTLSGGMAIKLKTKVHGIDLNVAGYAEGGSGVGFRGGVMLQIPIL